MTRCVFTVRVPKVRLVGALPALFGGSPGSFIVLEHVYNRSVENSIKDQVEGSVAWHANVRVQVKLGTAVAALHNKAVEGGQFGFATPTMLGPLALENDLTDDWATFFVEHRLGQQFRVAGKRYRDRALQSLWRRLQIAAPKLLAEKIQPSLLHGDLHVANAAAYEVKLGAWEPLLFDPACFCGDSELDLAIRNLVGVGDNLKFATPFYDAYFAARPKRPGCAHV
jgi:protein-ribulosamine 3-kinase